MNGNDIKDFLTLYLEGQLGYYIVNMQKIPAIRQSTLALQVQKKTGLEIVINRVPTNIKAGMNSIKKSWSINLVQHEGDHTLEDAIDRLSVLDIFENCVVLPAFAHPTRDSKIPEQAIITLSDAVVVNVVAV